MSDSREQLRKRAEQLLAQRSSSGIPESLDDARALIHELAVHQIEVDLQNEELRESNARAEQSRAHFFELFEHSPTPLLLVSRNAIVRQTNDRARTWFQALSIDAGTLHRMSLALTSIVDADDLVALHIHLGKVWADGRAELSRLTIGKQLPKRVVRVSSVLLSGSRFSDPKDVALVALEDITELHNAHVLVQRAREAAETASEHKTRFLANTSHELRTPLTTIIGYLQLEIDRASPGLAPANVATALKAARHLRGLIDDLLDLSTIELGKLQLDIAPFSPAHLIGEIASALDPSAAESGVEIACELTDLPAALGGDAMRIRQIITNLVSNAIRFSSRGSTVQISAAYREHSLVITVRDHGVGIPSDRRAAIFEAFYQVDTGDARARSGVGLGLSIARQLVQLMRGHMFVDSELGEGTTFTVQLPLEPSESIDREAEAAAAASTIPTMRVLVVDDDPAIRPLVTLVLEAGGHQAVEAEGGAGALRLLQEQRFDLVLLDIQMPEVDGFAVLEAIHHDPGLEGMPVIALTARAMVDEKLRIVDAGCAGIIAKPFDPRELLAAVEAILIDHRARL